MKTGKVLTTDNYRVNVPWIATLNFREELYRFKEALFNYPWLRHKPKKKWLYGSYWIQDSYKLAEYIYHYVLPKDIQSQVKPFVIPIRSLDLVDNHNQKREFTNLTKHWLLLQKLDEPFEGVSWGVIDLLATSYVMVPKVSSEGQERGHYEYIDLKWPYEKGYITKFYTDGPSQKTQAVAESSLELMAMDSLHSHFSKVCTLNIQVETRNNIFKF